MQVITMETMDYEWFVKTDLSEYAGEWFATLDQKVLVHGNDVEIVYKESKEKYPTKNPSLAKIPTGDTLILVM